VGARARHEGLSKQIRYFGPSIKVRTINHSHVIDRNGVETSSIILDKIISLKYWLDDPFWTRMSSPTLWLKFTE
jgi:hypothetical protein